MVKAFGKSQTSIAVSLLLVGALAISWILLAPMQTGGQVAYVIISGNSMEPKIHLGDLVLVRERSQYLVGDAVVYRHPGSGHVFHRIISQDGDSFTLKGDNNSWIDFHQPKEDDIVGKLWLHIPFAGTLINFLRKPINLALLTVVMVATVTTTSKAKQSRKSKRNQMNRKKDTPPESDKSISSNLEGIIVMGFLAVGALILGVFAFIRPIEKIADDNIDYQHIGILIYQAADSQDVYDTDEIQTGEPVFLQLTCDVQLFYSYQLGSAYLQDVEASQLLGNYRITARVSDPNGWNRTIGLAPLTEFTGPGFSAGMDLDLCLIGDLIAQMEQKTGTHNSWYDLQINPEVYVVGSILGRPFEDAFFPKINFQVGELLMRIPRDFDGGASDNLTSVQSGVIPGQRMAHNYLNILGLSIPIPAARWISISVFVLSLLSLVWLGWPIYKAWQNGDVSRIRVQYNPVLVDVQAGSISTNGQAIAVDSFKDLAKMAERYGAMILYEADEDSHKYCVQDGDMMYVYMLESGSSELALPDSIILEEALAKAIKFHEFELYYQPIVSTDTQQIEGMEALLRWHHPEKGFIYPAEFISRAEENGLMGLVDNWVIREACQQLKTWEEEIQPVIISINVSPQRFLQPDFPDWFSQTVKVCGCDLKYLQLEINRVNAIMHDELALKHLQRLKKMGVRLAIDNFAASTSNQVDSVTRMPVSSLKIDRTLVHRILKNPNDTRLVGAVVKMAQSLELHVVAEGVETQDQLAFLREHQIDAAQGYLTGRPMPAEEMTPMLIEGSILPLTNSDNESDVY